MPVTQLLAFVPVLSAMQMYAFNARMGLERRQACVSATVATAAAEVFSVITRWALLRRGVHGTPRTATVQPARAMQAT